MKNMMAPFFLAAACAPPPPAMPPPESFSLDTKQALGIGAGGGVSTTTDSSFGQVVDHISATQFWLHYRIDNRHMVGFQGAVHYLHDAVYNPLLGMGVFYRRGVHNDAKKYLGIEIQSGFPYLKLSLPIAWRRDSKQVYTTPNFTAMYWAEGIIPIMNLPIGFEWRNNNYALHTETGLNFTVRGQLMVTAYGGLGLAFHW